MISYIIAITIILLSFYKRELGLYVASIFAPALSTIIIPGLETVFFFVSFFFLLIYFRDIGKLINKKFPFKTSMIFFVIVWVLSGFIAVDKHYYALFVSVASNVVIPICCWISFKQESNQQLFLKIAKILCYIVVVYSLFEVLTRKNPYVDICITEDIFTGRFIDDIRFGLKRCQAFFSYHETLGGFCMITGAFFQYLYFSDKTKKEIKRICLRMMSLLYVTGFLTGSRSSMLAIVVAFFPFLLKKKKNLIVIPLLLLLLVWLMPNYFHEIEEAFLDTESVNGSNSEMRSEQLELSILYLNKSNNIWLGNGFAFADHNVVGVEKGMAGAESIWFRTMIDQGILGILCVAYTFGLLIYRCFLLEKNYIFFPLAYLVARTIAIIPSMNLFYIFPFIMLLIKLHEKK